jgi:hypothetical protein
VNGWASGKKEFPNLLEAENIETGLTGFFSG